MTRRLLAILNPISGKGRAVRLEPRLQKLAQAAEVAIEVEHTKAAGHAKELAKGAANKGFDAVIAVGGDGTVNEIVNGLGPRGLPLMVVPQGTGNVLGKELGATTRVMRYAQLLREWRVTPRDLGWMSNGRLFACFVGAGFDGQCTKALAERKGTMRMSQYVPIMWGAVRESDFRTLRVKTDNGAAEEISYSLVSITPCYGGPLALTRKAVPDDGKFDVLTIHKPIKPLSLLGLLARGFFRCMEGSKAARFNNSTRVEISADRAEKVPIQVDGDFAGYLPIECEILPGALSVFMLRR
jgi:diacylglycerol kinase (ATP)